LTTKPNPPRLHRLSDILEGLRSHIITDNVDLASDLPVGVIGHAHPARFGDAFKSGSNVDTVAKDVVVVDDDVAGVNADPEFDPLFLRHRRILLGHAALDFNGTVYRIHGTGKLNQHAVARGFDDPPAMRGDGGVNERLSDRLEPGQRAFLVDAHETTIAGNICRQYGCQPPFHPFSGQKMPLKSEIQLGSSKHVGLLSG
jgi:hypothetical protein